MNEQRGGTEVGGAGAVEEVAQPSRLHHELRALRLLYLDSTEHGGDGDSGGALDVVVVREEVLAVRGQ